MTDGAKDHTQGSLKVEVGLKFPKVGALEYR